MIIIATVSPSDTYTVVGLLLTLSGLLATFFSIQLSQWLMNLLATRAKWQAHKSNAGTDSADARRECRSELAGNYNPIILIANISVGLFVAFTIHGCFAALDPLEDELLKETLQTCLWAFIGCYGILTLGMLAYGYLIVGCRLDSEINPPPAANTT